MILSIQGVELKKKSHKILSKSINEQKFSLPSFMFSFALTLPTLINILKTTVIT